ncbi:MAG TPA: hypothetical protein VEN81_05575 [Planctomycetota bacterium]|nr:hypothetical protein [Planctomycetota bacterium]
MTEPLPGDPAAPGLPAAPPPTAVPKPRSRRWFVVLAWITLVVFSLFITGITVVTAAIPAIRRAHEAGR